MIDIKSTTIIKPASQLKQDQWAFAEGIGKLLTFVRINNWAVLGYQQIKVRLGDFNRPDKHGHMNNSRHYEMCAGDIILDVNGEYITDSHHPVYVEMGRFWESLDKRFRWGGRFREVDGNHFSIASPDGKRA